MRKCCYSYDLNRSKNLDIPYWKCEKFELDSLSDDECKSEFRFLKHDIYTLLDVLNLSDKITCQNRFSVYSEEALCLLLRRFAYPCRYEDLVPRFGRPGACFSKVPKLFGCFSSDITLFVSSKQRRLEARNFAVIYIFIPFTTYEKTSFTE